MTTKVYICSKPVAGMDFDISQHLYLMKVVDGDFDNAKVLRAGQTAEQIDGEYKIEIQSDKLLYQSNDKLELVSSIFDGVPVGGK